MLEEDWRLHGQEEYLDSVTFVWTPYRRWSESWDHDHCEFCEAKFMQAEPQAANEASEEILHEGYASVGIAGRADRYYWVCKTCFDDFRDRFGWIEIPAAGPETPASETNEQRTLAAAYERLRDQWRSGIRNRELGLHLMFVAWYSLVEPPHLTGLDESRTPIQELASTFNEVHDHFAPVMASDAEMLFVVGLMAHLFPYALGDESLWNSRSKFCRAAYRRLAPQAIAPAVFDGRGAYGEYFGGQARVKGGY